MIELYTSENCEYCKELQDKLTELDIKFTKVDVDADINITNVTKVFEFVGEPVIPIIILKPHVLAPKKSFNTINEAIILIQSLI